MRNTIIAADANCTGAAVDLSSMRYVRSAFPLGWPLLNYTDSGGAQSLGNATDWTLQWKVTPMSP